MFPDLLQQRYGVVSLEVTVENNLFPEETFHKMTKHFA